MRDSWSILDFIFIWLGGLLGGAVLGGIGFLVFSAEWAVILALAGGIGTNLAILWWLYRRKSEPHLGFELEPQDLVYLALGVFLQLAVAVLMLPLAERLFPEGGPPQEIARELADPDTALIVKLAVVVAAVLAAPVVEELIYRGVLLRAVGSRSRVAGIAVTAAVFSAVHIVTLTEPFLATAALVLPPLFFLGVVLAWLTLRSGRLGPAIFTHTGFNLVSALVLFLPLDLLEAAG